MGIEPHLAGALLGLALYGVIYVLFDRKLLAEIGKAELKASGYTDEQRRDRQRVLGYVKLGVRVVTPLLVVGYFAYSGPAMFGGAR